MFIFNRSKRKSNNPYSKNQLDAESRERENLKQEAYKQAQGLKTSRDTARQEGRRYGEELIGRNYQGLSPQQRLAYEESAKTKLNRDLQGQQRRLVAQQGARGVRGGAAYAQQADLARASMENQSQLQRDLNQLDSDLALKKLAAVFNVEQGQVAQSDLDRQTALDELRYEQEKKRQRMLENQYMRQLSRI
jgi:hypothetical protein